MIKEAIDTFLATVASTASGFWAGLWSPILEGWPWWAAWGELGIVVAACLFLAIFLPFKWIRLGLLVIIAFAVARLTGKLEMYNRMKVLLDAERARKKSKPMPPPKPREGGGFGGFFGGGR